MDYYTALLESYALLKKRKFKLTLKEEGESTQEVDDSALLAKVKDIAGNDINTAKELNGVNLWSNQDTQKAPEIIGAFGNQQGITITKNSGSAFRDPGNQRADSIIAALRGNGGNQENTEDPVMEANPNDVLLPVIDELQELLVGVEGTEETPGIEGLFPVEEDEKGKITILPSPLFDGYSPNKQKSRIQTIINTARKIVKGSRLGSGVRGIAGDDVSITDKVFNSDSITIEQKLESLTSSVDTLKLIKDINKGEKISIDTLRSVSSNLEVTQHGVMFNGVFLSYKSSADGSDDVWINSANQINDAIREHNNRECSNLEDGSKAKQACNVREIKSPPVSRSLNLAKRGLLVEKLTVLMDLASSNNNVSKQQIKDIYKESMKDGTAESAKTLLLDGLCTAGNTCLATLEGADSAEVTLAAHRFLVEEEGLSEAAAMKLVSRVTEADDGGTKALVLLVVASRGFSSSTDGLSIINSKVVGTKNSTLKGQKADIERTVTKESFDEWKKDKEDSMSDLEKELEEAAKCSGDSNVGLDALGTESDGNVTFGTEVKSRTTLSKGRTKIGEGDTSRVSSLCSNGSNNSLESQFIDANTSRIDNCTKNHGSSPWGKNSIQKVACGFQKAIDDKMSSINTVFSGGFVTRDDGTKIEGAGEEMVESWLSNRMSISKEDKNRAKLAKEALRAFPNATEEQSEALSKVRKNLEDNMIISKIQEFTDKDGVVSGEGLGYIAYRLGLEGGSLEETFKDARGYSDSTQKTGLINSSTYGAIGMIISGKAVVKQSREGSKTFNIVTKSNDKILKSSFERGQDVVSISSGSMSTPKKRGIKESTGLDPVQEFLTGTQELLERILRQTT